MHGRDELLTKKSITVIKALKICLTTHNKTKDDPEL